MPDTETQQLRHLTTERANLTAHRTRLKNRIHAVLHQRLIPLAHPDLFSAAGLRWLASPDLEPARRTAIRAACS